MIEAIIHKSNSDDVEDQFYEVEVVIDPDESKTVVFEFGDEDSAIKMKNLIATCLDVREN